MTLPIERPTGQLDLTADSVLHVIEGAHFDNRKKLDFDGALGTQRNRDDGWIIALLHCNEQFCMGLDRRTEHPVFINRLEQGPNNSMADLKPGMVSFGSSLFKHVLMIRWK